MVYTHGGLTGGYGLYLRDATAHFVYNMLALERYTVVSEGLPKGKVALAVNVAYEGKPAEFGRPATVTITANGKKVGEGRLPRTVPIQFSLGEGVEWAWIAAPPWTLPTNFHSPSPARSKVTVELK